MKLYVFVLCLSFNCFYAFSQYSYELRYTVGCFDNVTTELNYDFNRDLILHVDFQNKEVVFTMPSFLHFDTSEYVGIYRNAERANKACLSVQSLAKAFKLPEAEEPEVKDPPESILYPAEEVLLGVENSLVCFVNHFHPPLATVTWTKNNHPVSEGVNTSVYTPNDDQTFHCFSTLSFTPEQGDIYSCTVEHPALEAPRTRIWTVYLKSQQDWALDLYCGVGLTVALLGVGIGTYFIAKGCHEQNVL